MPERHAGYRVLSKPAIDPPVVFVDARSPAARLREEQDSSGWHALVRSRAAAWFLAIWLLSAAIALALALQPAEESTDVTHYKFWARLVAIQGMQAAYSGQYPETYSIYPPVTMYGLWVAGELYHVLLDPSFDRTAALASQWFTTAVRLVAVSMHLVLGGVLFYLLGRWAGPGRAVVGAGIYLLNPGALWGVAVWAQPDSWHAAFVLLALWQIGRGRAWSGGAWMGLALMTKPQAWALLPLAGPALLRNTGLAGGLKASLAGGAIVGAILLPFVLHGRLREFLTLPGQISSVMPVASANAHNLWWLVTRATVPFVFESERLSGPLPLTYRQAALLLLLPVLVFVVWRALRASGPWDLAGLAAYTSHAWFSLTTSAHENHPFMIVPFLCLVWWRSRFLLAVLVLVVGTFSFNVLVHDVGLAPHADALLGPWNRRLQLAASGLNLLVLGAWTVWLARPEQRQAGRLATSHT